MAMNQSIIFVGVGLLAAAALFMAQSKGVAAAPRPRVKVTPRVTTQQQLPTVPRIQDRVTTQQQLPTVPRIQDGDGTTATNGWGNGAPSNGGMETFDYGEPTESLSAVGKPEVSVVVHI
jgi:hypothetical protein